MNAFVSRGLITLAVTGGLLVFGAGAAHADDGTDGDGGPGDSSRAFTTDASAWPSVRRAASPCQSRRPLGHDV